MSAPVRRTSRICAPRTAAILLSSSAPGTMCVITIDRAAGMCIGEPSAFHRPLVPLGNCARHLPMVLIGTGIQGVSQLNVYLLKELKSLRVLSASTSCASHSTHRPPEIGCHGYDGNGLGADRSLLPHSIFGSRYCRAAHYLPQPSHSFHARQAQSMVAFPLARTTQLALHNNLPQFAGKLFSQWGRGCT
jgi:hypothetical protein